MAAVDQLSDKGAVMKYVEHMIQVLKMDSTVYQVLASIRLPLRYAMINVTLLGLIYGVASIQFATALLARQPGAAASFNPLMIFMAGLSIAFFMHGGLSLFVWVFCRGMGGNEQFMPTYLAIGIAAIGLWPLAPALSAFQSGAFGAVLAGYVMVATLYGASVIVVAVRAASGLSTVKMALAAAATVGYVGCFLYLWL